MMKPKQIDICLIGLLTAILLFSGGCGDGKVPLPRNVTTVAEALATNKLSIALVPKGDTGKYFTLGPLEGTVTAGGDAKRGEVCLTIRKRDGAPSLEGKSGRLKISAYRRSELVTTQTRSDIESARYVVLNGLAATAIDKAPDRIEVELTIDDQ